MRYQQNYLQKGRVTSRHGFEQKTYPQITSRMVCLLTVLRSPLIVLTCDLFSINQGELRIKVNPSCTEDIKSVSLQLQLDEFSEVKYL